MLPTSFRAAAVLAVVVSIAPALARAANGVGQQRQQMMQQMMQQQQRMIQQAQQQQQQMMRMIQRAQQQAQQQAQQMMRQQQRAAQILNRTMSRQAQQMARNARNMPRPVLQNVVAEYEFILADDGLIRSMSVLTPDLDEKGRPRKLDAEEKMKLKGDSAEERKLVGYKAGAEDLQPGDEVIVTLSRYRPLKHKSPGQEDDKDREPAARDKDAKKDKEDAVKEKARTEGAEKAKSKDKDAETDESDSAHKLAHLKDWKAQGKLHGIIVETEMSGSRRMVLAIQGQKIAMVAPNNRNNNNNKANAKAAQTAIDPSVMQGTFVVIVKRGQGGNGGASGGFGFGMK